MKLPGIGLGRLVGTLARSLPGGPAAPRSPRRIGGALAALALLAGAVPALAVPPDPCCAGFASVKRQLGTVPFLADVAEIELTRGGDKVYVEDCRSWAARAMEDLAGRVAGTGYRIGDRAVPSVGVLVNPERECFALSRFRTDHRLDLREQTPARSPFQVHEAFATFPGSYAEWDSVALAVWTADEYGRLETSLPRADSLADLLGSDVSFVLLGLGTRVPLGQQMRDGLDGLLRGDSGSREFRRLVLAVVDLRRGTILWWDEDEAEGLSLLSGDVAVVTKRFAARLP